MCATLDEYPRVRICKSNLKCVETLAQKVQSKLGKFAVTQNDTFSKV